MDFIINHLATVLVLLILAGIVSLIIRNMIRTKKEGKSIICGGSCGGCGGACMCHRQEMRESK